MPSIRRGFTPWCSPLELFAVRFASGSRQIELGDRETEQRVVDGAKHRPIGMIIQGLVARLQLST